MVETKENSLPPAQADEMRAPGTEQALLAVEGPRQAAQPHDAPEGGVTVETTVSVDAGNAPDDYAIEWPEGYEADPEAMGRFLPVARELGLAKEAAEKLAHLYVDIDRRRTQRQADMVAETNSRWLQEVREHPEFGGANLQRTGESVASLMRRYGSPLLMAQIRQMNVQNWPEMFYFLARVSQAMAEDCSPPSSPGRAATQTTAKLLFPDLN